MSSMLERIEYFAERQSRGELTAEDIAELTELCQDPDFARTFVLALADHEDWRRATRSPDNGSKFIQALLQRKSRPSPAFAAVVTAAARQRVREGPAKRAPFNRTRKSTHIAWLLSAAACVALAIVFFVMSNPGARNTVSQPAKKDHDTAAELAQIEEQRQRARRELAEVEMQRLQKQERLEEIERRRAELAEAPTANTPPNERQSALDLIEAERRKVDEELAAMRQARQKAEATIRKAEEARAKVETTPRTAEVATAPPPQPPPQPKTPEKPKVAFSGIARVEWLTGDVFIVSGSTRRKIEVGASVQKGEGLQTSIGANVRLSFLDQTILSVGGDTVISELSGNTAQDADYAKSVTLDRGSLIADVMPQPSTQPMLLRTAHADVTVIGTRFTLATRKESTWLEMYTGRVTFRNRQTGKAVQVSGGQTALMEPGKDAVVTITARFLKGINFGGEAVTVEGERWLSHKDALAEGLSLSAEPLIRKTSVPPKSLTDAALTEMLNTAVYANESNLALKQTVPNGGYELYLWLMEAQADYRRSYEIQVEGESAAQNVGEQMVVGDWLRLGPISATVTDGSLDIKLIKGRSDPQLMGLSIFQKVDGAPNPPPARVKPNPAE
ncbi:MAG TPA: FecR domain-containing protein [Planctomycetota bacterium]|nr:FecR domain-containing protein [Planctomycetota bacterium]